MNLGGCSTGDFWLPVDDGLAAGAKLVCCDVDETSDLHRFAARERRASRAFPRDRDVIESEITYLGRQRSRCVAKDPHDRKPHFGLFPST